jgi:hypothetical protein
MKNILEKYYENLASGNIDALKNLYHPEVTFKDPVFELQALEVWAMWKMLFSSGKLPIQIIYRDIIVNENMGSALWIADYTFSKTGRKVKNVIYSSFEIKDGKIFKQTENFDFQLDETSFWPFWNNTVLYPFL